MNSDEKVPAWWQGREMGEGEATGVASDIQSFLELSTTTSQPPMESEPRIRDRSNMDGRASAREPNVYADLRSKSSRRSGRVRRATHARAASGGYCAAGKVHAVGGVCHGQFSGQRAQVFGDACVISGKGPTGNWKRPAGGRRRMARIGTRPAGMWLAHAQARAASSTMGARGGGGDERWVLRIAWADSGRRAAALPERARGQRVSNPAQSVRVRRFLRDSDSPTCSLRAARKRRMQRSAGGESERRQAASGKYCKKELAKERLGKAAHHFVMLENAHIGPKRSNNDDDDDENIPTKNFGRTSTKKNRYERTPLAHRFVIETCPYWGEKSPRRRRCDNHHNPANVVRVKMTQIRVGHFFVRGVYWSGKVDSGSEASAHIATGKKVHDGGGGGVTTHDVAYLGRGISGKGRNMIANRVRLRRRQTFDNLTTLISGKNGDLKEGRTGFRGVGYARVGQNSLRQRRRFNEGGETEGKGGRMLQKRIDSADDVGGSRDVVDLGRILVHTRATSNAGNSPRRTPLAGVARRREWRARRAIRQDDTRSNTLIGLVLWQHGTSHEARLPHS
ncbi:hypothetical protein GGX14DRAFT_404699 [Mycena pura]|uniref:Uncharacterized protein n=1 Tax=Mycena pura TaxID=153505 RepID=A0AAD6XZW5_9AGAR|nr:hypothetical protein GGX14DRAFT_404699 [Mycena pura]